jgi:UDP-N-acetylglucosamine diphosphorylase / glucose-1-phosphate thymidylyltransferase / UDP-N-acetylgalactosamine diphosphorylase / glucosamine-1-phosphate N-acetyltransferase / galactosamine-1-phosphate N-acetyltransferase
MDILKPAHFFDLKEFGHRELFDSCERVWEALSQLSGYLDQHLRPNVAEIGCFRKPLPETVILWEGRVWREGFALLGGDPTKGTLKVRIDGREVTDATIVYAGCVIWDETVTLGPGAVVEPGALIKGPTIIGPNTEVRQGAYLRGKCLTGSSCVVGHTTEMKSSIMLDGAKAGHFAYIGDSILGASSNLGAGTKLANLKLSGDNIHVRVSGEFIDTGLRKLGAILGDGVEIGCNTVTNPGTILGTGSLVWPLVSVAAGYYGPWTVLRAPRS